METKNSERRYNTRFRGVPRSIFTYSRSAKKSSKSNDENSLRTEIRDDFVYTKLGKKSSVYDREEDSSPKSKIKAEPTSEKKPHSPEPTLAPIPNGTHKPPSDNSETTNSKDANHESSPEMSPKTEKETDGIFFETKPSETEEITSLSSSGSKSVWIPSKEKLSWNNSTVASYNPKTKMFRCAVCQAVGFMSRIGEHYLGTHCNAKVFHCPQCSYCSAWWRCVRNHMSKNHGVSNAPASMWKNQPLLDEIMQILQNLKYSVDCEDRVERVAENYGKRYICPKCPYATDRRDLYNRHENIHREEKPFQCYICYKLFNRADHVKKHFCRIHKEFNYDINLIRRLPSKRSRIPVSPSLNGGASRPSLDLNASFSDMMSKPPPSVSIPVTQSHLLSCLTGSPTMVRVSREIDHIPKIPENEIKMEEKNDNTFNKSHSNLLTFLTQNAFSTKPSYKSPAPKNTDTPIKDILQEALLKPPGYSSFLSSQPKKFMCPYCPWTGPNSWALRLHTSMHYKTFCVLCNFKSTEASDLENHMWECHKKRSCNKCNFLADSLLALDAHMLEVHGQKPQFNCRHCSQTFEVRSDMEAHCIFIHNQVLQECKENGCDFCTTDPCVLETHRKENHNSSSTSQDTSASRTLCLYCGCDFADPQSLTLHEELFHENPLQKANRRPLNPYCCSVCGYSTPKQPMMMEHMRIHTGQTLRCQAGEGCHFDTPYDTVLREHVLQSHSNDDGIVRCPHCGFRCSTRYSFVTHYKEFHHPFCCQLCEDVEHKHFVLPFTTSYLNSSITALFPFAKQVNSGILGNDGFEKSDDAGRRSRKQMQPRKVVVQDATSEDLSSNGKPVGSKRKAKRFSFRNSEREKFISLYAEKVKKIAQASLYKCRICVKIPIFFRHKRNYLLHRQWHYLKKHQCNKCIQTFSHRYQVLLHQREHMEKEMKVSS